MAKRGDCKSLPQMIKEGFLDKERKDNPGRQLKHLQRLTFASVLTEYFAVQSALFLIFRDVALDSPLKFFAHLMASYVITRCLGGKKLAGWKSKLAEGTIDLDTFIGMARAINPFCDVDRNCLWKVTALLRLHPVWKLGDETVSAMRDPYYRGLLSWYNWQCDVQDLHVCTKRQRAVLLTLLLMLANRSKRLLEYCLAHKDFLVGGTYCLQRLYDDVIMFKGVYTGLKDESAASRSVATSEQKLWSIGHLVDMLLVPSWENPGLLDQMLAAKTVDDFVEGLKGHKKFDGALVFTHSLEYFALLLIWHLWEAFCVPLYPQDGQTSLSSYQVGNKLVPGWYQVGKNCITNCVHVGTQLAPTCYQVGTGINWYRSGTNSAPTRYQLDANRVPLWYKFGFNLMSIG